MSRRFTKEQIARMCLPAQKRYRGQVISTAWAKCLYGTWMAWWLYDILRVEGLTNGTLKDLAYRELNYTFMYSDVVDVKKDRQFADLLRQRFTSMGKPRKVKVA